MGCTPFFPRCFINIFYSIFPIKKKKQTNKGVGVIKGWVGHLEKKKKLMPGNFKFESIFLGSIG